MTQLSADEQPRRALSRIHYLVENANEQQLLKIGLCDFPPLSPLILVGHQNGPKNLAITHLIVYNEEAKRLSCVR